MSPWEKLRVNANDLECLEHAKVILAFMATDVETARQRPYMQIH